MRARLPRLASVAVPSPSHHQPPAARDHSWPAPSSRDRPTGSEHALGLYASSERAKDWPRSARRAGQVDQLVTSSSGSASTSAQDGSLQLREAPESSGSRQRHPQSFPFAGKPSPVRRPTFVQTGATLEAGTGSSREPSTSKRDSRSEPAASKSSGVAPRRTIISHLESLSLPVTEPELYQFLRQTKAAYTSLPVEWLASFHSHGNLAHLVSSRTYRFLLRAAFGISDLRLVRALLAEIKDRGIRIDDATSWTVLRGYAALGPRLRREDEAVRTALMEELGEAGAAVARPTRRRNFGQSGKGLNDLDELWKGWTVRGRDSRLRDQLEGLLSSPRSGPEAGPASPATKRSKVGSSSPRAKANLRNAEPASSPMRRIALSRPPTLIPPLAHTLPGPAVAALTQALVSDRRKDDALGIAESWLAANRLVLEPPSSKKPPDPPPALEPAPLLTDRAAGGFRPAALSSYLRQAAAYHSTAVVLLNILLKPLFLERAPLPVIRTFVASFVRTHSAARPAPPLVPDIVTLRTLVAGVLGTPTAWDRATSLVDWFGYQWGIPLADPCSNARHRFPPPPDVEAERLEVAPRSAGAGSVLNSLVVDERQPRSHVDVNLLLVKPHAVVSPDVALLLLRHAADQYSRGLHAQSASRRRVWRQSIRAWWRSFYKDDATTDVWTGQKARSVVRRAVKAGMFKPKELIRGSTRCAVQEMSSSTHRL